MLNVTLRAAALLTLSVALAGCVVYDPGPGYAYAAPPPSTVYAAPPAAVYGPPVYGPPVYGSVVIGGGWGGRRWR